MTAADFVRFARTNAWRILFSPKLSFPPFFVSAIKFKLLLPKDYSILFVFVDWLVSFRQLSPKDDETPMTLAFFKTGFEEFDRRSHQVWARVATLAPRQKNKGPAAQQQNDNGRQRLS